MNRILGMFSPEGYWAKAIKFVMAGGMNTTVNYVIYVALVHAGLHYNLALILEYMLGTLSGYLMNRYWTFASHGRTYSSFPKYGATCGILYVINVITLNLIVGFGLLDPVFGQVLALGVATVINFLLQNFWVFRAGGGSMQNRGS